jgi:phospholipid transport system substrate-binding protein
MTPMKIPRRLAALCVAAGLAGPAALLVPAAVRAETAAAPAAQLGPQEQMESVARELFAALDANRAAIRKDPEKAFPLVDRILLPHFDTAHAAQLILAQHWRTATPEQRKRFIDAMYYALLRTYGGAVGDFTADRFKILPFRGDLTAPWVTVQTKVTRASGAEITVDYSVRRTPDGWKAFDVVIESVSYVKNYRTDLGAEISKKGLDAVIARLEKEGLDTRDAARPAAPGHH